MGFRGRDERYFDGGVGVAGAEVADDEGGVGLPTGLRLRTPALIPLLHHHVLRAILAIEWRFNHQAKYEP